MRRVPWTAIGLTVATVLLWAFDGGLGRLVEYDRAALASGQIWRLVTGHWSHWSADHLLWDLVVFAVVGGLFEHRFGAARLRLVVLGAALVISIGLWGLRPDIARFRGLSGLDCALVVALGTVALREALGRGDRRMAGVQLVVLLGYGAKTGLEWGTGVTLFVSSTSATFVSVPLAHALGGLVGLVAGFLAPRASVTTRRMEFSARVPTTC